MKVLSMSCGVMPVAAAISAFSWMFGQSTPARTKAPLDAAVYAALIDSLIRSKADTLLVERKEITYPFSGFRRRRRLVSPHMLATAGTRARGTRVTTSSGSFR